MPSGTGIPTAIERIARKCKIQPMLVEDAYPCTSLQAALVAADLQGLGDYVSRFVFRLSKAEHEQHNVRAACEDVYHQNAILRSRVIENGGQFLQVVTTVRLHWLEADNLQDYLAEDRRRTTALGEPLARFAWIQQADGATYMVWSLHHCQYDEWSFKLLLADLNISVSPKDASTNNKTRTPLAKFVKGLNKINGDASRKFWKENLQHVSTARRICRNSTESDTFRTSKRCEKGYSIDIPFDSAYQPSVLAVAAWSLLVGRLSQSPNVLFGHVLSGRAFDLEGIQEVCGPTLTTVPWLNVIPYEKKVKDYLDQLQDLRMHILPFEQTGLSEYRRLLGTAAFDTLLSVRSSQDEEGGFDSPHDLQPERPDATELNHPCCIFFEVELTGKESSLKASYDARWVDAALLENVMDKFVAAVETLPQNLETDVKSFEGSLSLPHHIEVDHKERMIQAQDSENDHDLPDLDPEIIAKVRKLALNIAGVKEATFIEPTTTLMQLGMDSLKTVVLSRHLNKAFSTSLPFKEIAGPGRSLSSICTSIQKALSGSQSSAQSSARLSLLEMADKHMKTIQLEAPGCTRKAKPMAGGSYSIILTGATGYLGIEILRQCLHTSAENIIVLVRCNSASDGMDRIRNAAQMATWESSEVDQLQSKVSCWPSDLSKEQLGLEDEHWQLLTNGHPSSSYQLRAIIHNGAKVDFLHSYSDMELANVRSTAILLDLQSRYAVRPNFVFVTGGRPCPLHADGIEQTATKLASAPGYAQTKFVSEILVHKVKEVYEQRGQAVSMSIVHPGAIIGSTNNGVANTDDFVWRYVAASQGMGSYVSAVPTKREWINLTPVDSVAAMTVSHALQEPSSNGTSTSLVERCLMRAGLPISKFWAIVADVLRTGSISLKPVSEWEWLTEFEADLNIKGQAQPLFSLSQLLLQGDIKGIGGLPPNIDIRSGLLPDTTSVEKALKSNVQYLLSMGFFSDKESVDHMFGRSKA